MNSCRVILIATVMCMLTPFAAFGSTVHKEKRFGEPRADKALVYVIREKAFAGGGVGIFVFADKQLLAFLRNNTYSFGYVEPGSRLIWGDTPSGLDVQLIAGETYYVEAGPGNPVSLVTEAEGKAAIQKVGAFIESDQTDIDNGANKVAKRYEKVQQREAKKEKAQVEQVAVATAAQVQAEGTEKLAANTKLPIELMENLSSSLNKLGETVWFRVADDVKSGEHVLIPRGARVKATIRQAGAGSGFGAQGTLDVVLVSIDLDAGTRVPLVGQLAAAGQGRQTAGAMVMVGVGGVVGVAAGAFIKGTEAFHPVGTQYSAWTRDEIWLRPAVTSAEPAPAHTGITAPARDLVFGANTRRNPPPLDLAFPCSADVSDVQLVSISDWTLVEPVRSLSTSRAAETCTVRFASWSVLRHVRPTETPQALHLHGRSGAGEMHVDIPVRIRIE